MARWEYRKIPLNDVRPTVDDIDVLNDAGDHGWELVGITTNNVAYLKRPIDEPVPAAPPPGRRGSTPATGTD